MFNLAQLADQRDRCISGAQSLDEFEGWFSLESHRIRGWADERLLRIADSIEQVFSRYHFEGLDDAGAIGELRSLELYPVLPLRVTATLGVGTTDIMFRNQADLWLPILGTSSTQSRALAA